MDKHKNADNQDLNKSISETDIENVLQLLKSFSETETSRMKLTVSEALPEGEMKREYHHGRCDVGSPFATGEAI